MKKIWKKLVCVLLLTTMVIFNNSFCYASESSEKTTIEGMEAFILLDDEGHAVLEENEAKTAGYNNQMIEYVQGNLKLMNELSDNSGVRIDKSLKVEVYTDGKNVFGAGQLKAKKKTKGVSKVVTTWNRVRIYMNNVDTLVYCLYLQKWVQINGNLRQTLSDYADYKHDDNVKAAATIAGLNSLMAWLYLYPAQQAAKPGRGIIMQTDIDYVTMSSTVSYLSQ